MGKDVGIAPQGSQGKKHPPGDQPLWLLPLALSEVSCFLTLLDSSFGDNCCPSVFPSRAVCFSGMFCTSCTVSAEG